jgi:thiol-disulfide isomerase/thioredoxin
LIGQGDIAGGAKVVEEHRKTSGDTPEALEAMSWLGRGSLAAGQLDAAENYARKTYELATALLSNRKLDDEKRLPIALGAAIEVQAQVMAQRNERADAVAYLRKELLKYRTTSIRTRIQKNINLLTLAGKPAPALEVKEWVGPKPAVSLTALRGRPVLLFFWAHWCPDCKAEAPILARLQQEHKNLLVVGPTQHYGYVAGGEDAPRDVETKYIEQVRKEYYDNVRMTVPVSEETFKNYGASTSPTLVLIDPAGIVRVYHPGRMTYEELEPLITKVTAMPKPPTATASAKK